jgi:chemotaxis protein methyltransferase CheR
LDAAHDRDESISSRDYSRLCHLVYGKAGIHLGADRRTMLEARIRRRLKDLAIPSYGAYCDYLFSADGQREELDSLIDVVTTNKTDFFREPRHFDLLTERVLPELAPPGFDPGTLTAWSAGCSSGEEPYTLAMVLSEYREQHPEVRFRILATDISRVVLNRAEMAVYSQEVVQPVPAALRAKYLMRGREPGSSRFRIVPELRRIVEFRRLNLMDSNYGLPGDVHLIFCRNVIIYFDRSTQQRILGRLSQCLAPGGYLFVGHAETLHSLDLPLVPVAPALYRRVHASA